MVRRVVRQTGPAVAEAVGLPARVQHQAVVLQTQLVARPSFRSTTTQRIRQSVADAQECDTKPAELRFIRPVDRQQRPDGDYRRRVTDTTGWRDLGFARVDTARAARTGDPEVIFGQGKTPEQVVELLRTLRGAHPRRAVLATRLDEAARTAVRAAFGDEVQVEELARCATLGPFPAPTGTVAVVAAGTSDGPVAAEAAATVRAFGATARVVTDVGVAGIHRLLAVRDELDSADCLVVVAGMEGALPSVVGGLTGVPIVAVPTSVGYGASLGGVAALLAMLNSCAPGVVVVNIDNGFGAGVHAARVARQSRGGTADRSAVPGRSTGSRPATNGGPR